mmetsp:Transcript_21550/g.31904  ORF Transcript_21550/g.31904 Transcript_21550/m.31904 type:complete len:347 (-) Transcript_21550:655-1695(-)
MSLKEIISADNSTDEEAEGVLAQEAITEFGNHDMLLGRGGVSNNHPGNVHFRQIVEDHKEAYKAIPRHRKTQMAKDIVRKWRDQSPPGRFLKKMDNGNGWYWYDVGDAKARNITSQKLREQATLSEGDKKNDIGRKKSLRAPTKESFKETTGMEASQRMHVVQKKKNDQRFLRNMLSGQHDSKPVWIPPPQLMNPRSHASFKAQPNTIHGTHPGWCSLHANTESQQYNGFQAQQDHVGRLNSLESDLLSRNNTGSSIPYAILRSAILIGKAQHDNVGRLNSLESDLLSRNNTGSSTPSAAALPSSILNGNVLPKKRNTDNQNESNEAKSQVKRPNRQQLRVSQFDA